MKELIGHRTLLPMFETWATEIGLHDADYHASRAQDHDRVLRLLTLCAASSGSVRPWPTTACSTRNRFCPPSHGNAFMSIEFVVAVGRVGHRIVRVSVLRLEGHKPWQINKPPRYSRQPTSRDEPQVLDPRRVHQRCTTQRSPTLLTAPCTRLSPTMCRLLTL